MKKYMYAVVLCMLMLPALSFAEDPTKLHYLSYCSFEGMLGWYGDPALKGSVKHVRITQYRAEKSTNGSFIKKDADKPIWYAELFIAPDGTLSKEIRTPRGDPAWTDITEYNRDGYVRYAPGRKEEAIRSVRHRDGQGHPVRLDVYRGDTLIRTEERYAYNAKGRVHTKVNSLGQLAIYSYDERGNCIREDWASKKNPRKRYLSRAWTYDAQNRVTKSVLYDPVQKVSFEAVTEYDAVGNKTRVLRYKNQGKRITMQSDMAVHYDHDGTLLRRTLLRGGDGYYMQNRYVMNGAGYVTGIDRTVRDWDGNMHEERIRFTHDAEGNWLSATRDAGKETCIIERVIAYYPYSTLSLK